MPTLFLQTGRLALHFGTVPCPPTSALAHPSMPPPVPAPSDVPDQAGAGDVYASRGSEGADPHLSLRSLRHVKVMGRGSFGKVLIIYNHQKTTNPNVHRGISNGWSAVG